MHIATWNVNGIRAREAQFCEWLKAHAPDVVCIQEIKASADQLPASVKQLDDYWAYWHESSKGYSGVALFMRKSRFESQPVFCHPAFDMESRLVEGVFDNTRFASVYMPNGGKDYAAKIAFYQAMVEHVREVHARGERLVICGDVNIALTDKDVHPSQQKADVIGQRPEERALFQQLLDLGLVDTTRVVRPDDDRFFTWWPYWKEARKRNIGWRIDGIYTSTSLGWRVTSADVLAEFGTSDHAPLHVRFEA